jgi:hypothetical protein
MRMSFRFGLAALAAAALLGTAQDARAVYAPQLVGVTPDGANFRWSYNVVWGTQGSPAFQLTTGTGANAGVLSPGTVGSQDFVTLYDIEGYVPGSALAGGSHTTLTPEVFVGITGPNTLPDDLPTRYNLTFRFSAGTQGPDATFTGFSFLSNLSGAFANPLGFYTSQFTNTAVANSKVGEIGRVTLPAIIPEPSSVALIGMGVAGLFGYGYRRRRQG